MPDNGLMKPIQVPGFYSGTHCFNYDLGRIFNDNNGYITRNGKRGTLESLFITLSKPIEILLSKWILIFPYP